MTEPTVTMEETASGPRLHLGGPLTLPHLTALAQGIRERAHRGPVMVDIAKATVLDTAGAWLLLDTIRRLGGDVVNATAAQTTLIETVSGALGDRGEAANGSGHASALERLGRGTVAAGRSTIEIVGFLGLVMLRLARTILAPRRLRLTAVVSHIQQAGLNALPIVVVMALLIGVVLAYQGAQQLAQFGAEVFVVDLVAVSILRELGVLLTAILVAGRSASAFTAAIGSARMNQEVDAMQTIGLDPIEVLVLPRVLALVIFLPALVLVADIAGLVGGALMAWAELGVSPGVFHTRLLDVDVSHFLIGMAKAPFFAAIIGVIGCFHGMKVEGNAESLGRLTSRSVVQAIFAVIVADAAFSILFAAAGL
jgi:phospholipid/cholesterol/gamma-HCH transport system permease protein